jgi:hypothetical protein
MMRYILRCRACGVLIASSESIGRGIFREIAKRRKPVNCRCAACQRTVPYTVEDVETIAFKTCAPVIPGVQSRGFEYAGVGSR